MIADSDKERCRSLRKKIGVYKKVHCIGNYSKEQDLIEEVWREQPDIVLVHVGDNRLNAFSVLAKIKEIASETRVIFYSEAAGYAVDAYEREVDYFLQLPADDISIAKMLLNYCLTKEIS